LTEKTSEKLIREYMSWAIEAYVASKIQKSVEWLCELLDKWAPNSRRLRAALIVISGLMWSEDTPTLIKKVSENCGYNESYSRKVVNELLKPLREKAVLAPGSVEDRWRGRPPLLYKIDPSRLFNPPNKLRIKLELYLILTGTIQRFLNCLLRTVEEQKSRDNHRTVEYESIVRILQKLNELPDLQATELVKKLADQRSSTKQIAITINEVNRLLERIRQLMINEVNQLLVPTASEEVNTTNNTSP
jgi:hypothetical protein